MKLLIILIALCGSGCTLLQRDQQEEKKRDITRHLVREEVAQQVVETAEGPKIVTLKHVTTEREMTQEQVQSYLQSQMSSPVIEQVAQTIGGAVNNGLGTGVGSLAMLAGAWLTREVAPRILKRPQPPAPAPSPPPETRARRREDET